MGKVFNINFSFLFLEPESIIILREFAHALEKQANKQFKPHSHMFVYAIVLCAHKI